MRKTLHNSNNKSSWTIGTDNILDEPQKRGEQKDTSQKPAFWAILLTWLLEQGNWSTEANYSEE
jgi:hypothetical protein